ncbi:MAG: cobalt-precorrin-5B (C(1))-methyltransferase CbiD [Desulfonauticus sp.]|nr:cobalt-precorrin-5B (C(1))-methyltransferase CbiD [Desulfonauticus sp.]
MRLGFSTSTYAAALAKAGALFLTTSKAVSRIWLKLPADNWVQVPVQVLIGANNWVILKTIKNAGDDPDVTHGLVMYAVISLRADNKIEFAPGTGIGLVTKPGLPLPPGSIAINPEPRKLIAQAIRQVTAKGINLSLHLPKGMLLAKKTFNPRLGIVGGLSILGTSGRVRPFSLEAIRETIKLHLQSLLVQGVKKMVLVPGHLGQKGAKKLGLDAPIVEVSNEWDCAFSYLEFKPLKELFIVGHPGKLLKFLANDFNTHSQRSCSAVPIFKDFIFQYLGEPVHLNTVEHGFYQLNPKQRIDVANILAKKIAAKILSNFSLQAKIKVFLIDYQANILNSCS